MAATGALSALFPRCALHFLTKNVPQIGLLRCITRYLLNLCGVRNHNCLAVSSGTNHHSLPRPLAVFTRSCCDSAGYNVGVVKAVLSGDTIVVMGPAKAGPPPELQITLASLQAPTNSRHPDKADDVRQIPRCRFRAPVGVPVLPSCWQVVTVGCCVRLPASRQDALADTRAFELCLGLHVLSPECGGWTWPGARAPRCRAVTRS